MGKLFSSQDLASREPKVVGSFVEKIHENKMEHGIPKVKDKNRLKERSKQHRRVK